MKYETKEKEGIVIITPKGKMTAGPDLEKLHDKIKELVRIGARRMVIDLGEVELMDSRGLGILVAGLTSLKKVGGGVKVSRINKKKQYPLATPPLSTVFKTFGSADEALKSFQAGT